jgi:ribonuclease HI
MMLHKGMGTTQGPTPAITLWLYTGIVRPALTYGAAVWAHRASHSGNAHKLKQVQRLGMLRVSPMRRNTPTTGLEVILGVPPLSLYIQSLASATYNRLHLKPNVHWTGQRGNTLGHINWLQSISITLPHKDLQDRCVTNRWTRLYHTYIGDGEDVPPDTPGILCYTDGSGRYEGSGSGLAVYENSNSDPTFCTAEYTGAATVFQSEVRAISMACEYVTSRQPTQVTILSDSQAALMAITNPLQTSQTVTQTVDTMNLISQKGHNVLLSWVRGHNGAQGNEMADCQANLGAASRPEGT